MNVGACLFGAMPCCHGSGGLAGQNRFGARTGGSVVVLGLVKLGVGIFFGSAAMAALAAFPVSILAVLLIFAGLALAAPVRRCKGGCALFVAILTAAGILAVNTCVGFLLGLTVGLVMQRLDDHRSGV
jgi:hypothetical protein